MKLQVYKCKINYYTGLLNRWEDKYKNEAHLRHQVERGLARERSNMFLREEKIKSLTEEIASKKDPLDSKLHESKLQRDQIATTTSLYDKDLEIRTLKSELSELEEQNVQLQANYNKKLKVISE